MEFKFYEAYGKEEDEAEYEETESGLKVVVGSKEYWNCQFVEGSVLLWR